MNQYIDHTILKQTTTTEDIIRICNEANDYNFAAVCIPPCYIELAVKTLKELNSKVKVCTVIGFPFGYSTIETKLEEIIDALSKGAQEIDIVQNITSVKNGEWQQVECDIHACLKTILRNMNSSDIPTVKVILESGILTDDEIIECCKLYNNYSVDNRPEHLAPIRFLKTSTGYAEKGASVHHVELIRKHSSKNMEIKASGGIRDYIFAKQLIDAGATRLGCSAGVKIIEEFKSGVVSSEVVKETY